MHKRYITRQEDIKDCGAACISSVLKYYDGYVPMEVLRKDTLTNTNGTTAFHLIKALQKYGFAVTGYKIDDILEEKIVLPAIAHVVLPNNLHHFVVIYQIDKVKNTILLMDPAYGYKTLSIKEFKIIWTNIILLMEPKYKMPKYKKSISLFHLFWKLLIEDKRLLIKILIISFFLIALSIISSFYIKVILSNQAYFYYLIIAFLIITILKLIFNFLRSYYENILNKHIDEKVIIPFLKHLFFLPLEYAKSKTTGEIITRVRELNNIKNLFTKIFITILLDATLAIITLFFVYKINKMFFLILCFILIIYLIQNIAFSPAIKVKMETLIEEETDFNSTLVENIDGLETIKNNNQNDNYLNKTKLKFLKYLESNHLFSKLLNKQELFKSLALDLGVFLITTIGIYMIILNKLTMLDLITFNALLIYVLEPFKNIAHLIPEFNFVKTSFNKINEFTMVEEENLMATDEIFINGDIEIKNMSYSYNHYNYVIDNLNLLIKQKEKIILKGESGSGKSTICKLIYRLYNPDQGDILINNKNINEYGILVLRNNITYLSQKEKLFNDTIKNNVVFNREVSDSYYQKIIKICRVDEIIKNKSFKDETMISDNGFNLSGGEIQRIILARALIKEAKIIILDEALSEVEPSQETLIIKDLLAFFADRTIIYVTHRHKDSLFDRSIIIKQSNKIYQEGEKNENIK